MKKRKVILAVIFTMFFSMGVSPARTEVTWSGDLDPADPTTWTPNVYGYIGNTGNGTLSITNGDEVSDKQLT